MRFAGSQVRMDPSEMEYVTDRMAGQVVKERPDLVERITEAIVPGSKVMKRGGNQ